MARMTYVFWEEGELHSIVAEPWMQWPLIPGRVVATASVEFPEASAGLEAICAIDSIERQAAPDVMTTLDKILTQVFNEGIKEGYRECRKNKALSLLDG